MLSKWKKWQIENLRKNEMIHGHFNKEWKRKIVQDSPYV